MAEEEAGEDEVRRSPLEGRVLAAEGVSLRELPFLAQINLRGRPDKRFTVLIEATLGCPLPLLPNTVREGNSLSVLWLGPDEWLVVGPADTEWQIEGVLNDALAGVHASVVDVSASRTVLELSGPKAREVLAKGCALDLHPRSFGPGRCAQTLLAKAQIILRQTADDPVYQLFVRSSFARYLAAWLDDAMMDLGGAGGSSASS